MLLRLGLTVYRPYAAWSDRAHSLSLCGNRTDKLHKIQRMRKRVINALETICSCCFDAKYLWHLCTRRESVSLLHYAVHVCHTSLIHLSTTRFFAFTCTSPSDMMLWGATHSHPVWACKCAQTSAQCMRALNRAAGENGGNFHIGNLNLNV